MVTRFTREAGLIVKSAQHEARARRSPLIEAEHLLLALAAGSRTDASRVLTSAGLSHAAIESAVSQEFAASLSAAGVTIDAETLPPSTPEPRRRLRLGASSKAAMVRAVRAAEGERQIRPAHLLLGILGAQVGTVPRALQLADVDQAELTNLTEQAL